MTDQVTICNRGLQKLGSAGFITSLSDNTTNARAMNIAYDVVRRAELRRHRWRFSIKRTNLAKLSTAPANGIFTNQFQLPSDCLRVIDVGDWWPGTDISAYRGRTVAEYSIEGNIILTNYAAPLSLRYVRDVTDTGTFDAAFTEAFAARLAWETCETITQSAEKRKLAITEYGAAIKEAIRVNALESPPEFAAADSWESARIA